jgi:hypothetical protein
MSNKLEGALSMRFYRGARRSWSLTWFRSQLWRNDRAGDISCRIDRKDVVARAIEANNYIDQNYLPSSLLDRIKDVPTFTVAAWLERYEVILERRELKPTHEGQAKPDRHH